MPAPVPPDEPARLRCLQRLDVLDTPADPVLDGLVRCAAALTGCPIAMVSLVDEARQWFMAREGIAAQETPRDVAFCAHAILGDGLLEVPDAHADARFAGTALVTGEPHIRFYAGMPLKVDGHALGTLCVIDHVPRTLAPAQRALLADLAAAAEHWLAGRREQQQLAEGRARLAALARVEADWMCECDADGIVRWGSAGVEPASGLSAADFIGRSLPDPRLCDELGDPLPDGSRLRTLLAAQQRFVGAKISFAHAGGRHWYGVSGLPRIDEKGRFAGWYIAVRDTSALVQERREARARFRLLSQTSRLAPGLIFQLRRDRHGIVSVPFATERATEMYEATPAQLREDPLLLFRRLHPDDHAAFTAGAARSAEAMAPWHHVFRVVLPQRGVRWLEGTATPEPDGQGGIVWHGFVTDVTERRELDAAVATSREREAAATAASRDKSAFLSRLSHEMRTPLNAVLGFAQLLQDEPDDPLTPRQKERVAAMQCAGRSLVALLDDVVDIGAAEPGAAALALRPVSLGEALRPALETLRPLAEERAVRIGVEPPAEMAWVLAEPRALQRVVGSLLSNAVKFNRHGGEVRVSVERLGGDRLRIDVSDEGEGIAPERIEQLCQPFARLGAENSSVRGSGLGLAVAQQLVLAMGGRLTVDSEPSLGSVFHIELGAAQPAPAAAEAPASVAAAGATLLYIEDEPLNALLLEEALRRRPDWRLVTAADGIEGLARARRLRPDLVLTDINLPGLTGLEIVQALRSDPKTRGIACVALSADAHPEQIERARRAGCDDYWTKPLDLREVVSRIERQLAAQATA